MAAKSQRDMMRAGLKRKIAELEQTVRTMEAEVLLKENQVGRLESAFIKMREFINNELVVMRAQPPQAPPPGVPPGVKPGECVSGTYTAEGGFVPDPPKGADDADA